MSVISEKTAVAKPLIPNKTNVPLDARTVCDSVLDFSSIEMPYLGMVIYTRSDSKYWRVTELQPKQIGIMSVADAQIKSYEEFSSGTTYTAGEGISISNGVISCTVKGGTTYTAGVGISISNGVISCTVTSGPTYTAGNGIEITDNKVSIKGVLHIDKPQDGLIGLYTDENGLHFAGDMLVTQQQFSETIGDIDSILDAINGEEV